MDLKYILWSCLGIAALTACSGDTYTGELPDANEGYLAEPIPVVLDLGVPSYDILTRGSGAFENTIDASMKKLWENARFYVYAFNKDVNVDLRTPWNEGYEDVCLLDGNRTSQEKNMGGREIRVNIDDTSLMPFWPDWDNMPIFYNTQHTDWPYNFFAYYIDDSPMSPERLHREKDHIYLDVEVDGRRDFMSSIAQLTDDQIQKLDNDPNKQKTIESCYSAYSGNRGVNPVFRFKHHLVRFKFKIYPGGDVTAENIELSRYLYLQSVRMTSKVDGQFTVAVSDPLTTDPERPKQGIVFSDNARKDWFSLGEGPIEDEGFETSLRQKYYFAEMKEEDAGKPQYERTAVPVGGSFLMASDSHYELKLKLEQYDASGNLVQNDFDKEELYYELNPPSPYTVFEAGKAYTIRIAVFSPSRIEVGFEPGEWGDGGGMDVDPGGGWEDNH